MIEQMRRLQTGCALTPQQQCTQHLYKSIWNLRASSDLDYTRCLESLYVGFWFSVLFCFFNVLGFFQNQRLLQLFWENAASPFCCEAPEILFYKQNYAWLPSSWGWVDDYWTSYSLSHQSIFFIWFRSYNVITSVWWALIVHQLLSPDITHYSKLCEVDWNTLPVLSLYPITLPWPLCPPLKIVLLHLGLFILNGSYSRHTSCKQ